MKKISVTPLDTYKAVDCLEDSCPFSGACANHHTAGDFRIEEGMSPRLELIDNEVYCKEFGADVVNTEYGGGAVLVEDLKKPQSSILSKLNSNGYITEVSDKHYEVTFEIDDGISKVYYDIDDNSRNVKEGDKVVGEFILRKI